MRNLSDLRIEYTKAGLSREILNDSPFIQFDHWFNDAMESGINEPNAMSLATSTKNGHPSLRTVLLKYYDANGFVFFTNYKSKKAEQIEENEHVSILFPWISLHRQIIIQGKAEKITKSDSLKYFVSRPHGSQLGAWISLQSSVITSRNILEMKLNEIKKRFSEGKVPLPDFWGGYRIKPSSFEFWQGRENRLHDRFMYEQNDKGIWEANRLAP